MFGASKVGTLLNSAILAMLLGLQVRYANGRQFVFFKCRLFD